MSDKIIDLQRLLEEEDCVTSTLELFKNKLSEFNLGDEVVIVTSSADAWFAMRNMGDKLGYYVLKYWKEPPNSYKLLIRRD